MIALKATNLRQQTTYKDSIYSSAIFSGNKQNPYTVQLWIEATHRYRSSAKSTRTKHPFDYILASCIRLLDPVLNTGSEMTHGKGCLLSPLTYTKRLLGQPRNVSFCTELFSWKLIFWNRSQYPSLFSCWPVPNITANFNERETFRGEYRHSMEERIMPASPDGAKAWVQPLGHSVNFLLDGYCNLTPECRALGLIWP